MQWLKQHLAIVLAGMVVVGGFSYVAVADVGEPSSDEVVLAQNEMDEPDEGRQRPHHGPGFPHAIRGELVVPEREGDGYTTVRLDRGILERVDGATLVIEEADGTSVEIPTTDETRVYRDGEEAELSELRAGDHVATFREKDGDAFITKGVRAISPERWEEYEERREDGPRQRFRGPRPGAA